MVHPRKPIHRSTEKQPSNRLSLILEPIQKHTLWVWSIFALVAIAISYEALSVLLNPEAVESEAAIAEVREDPEPLEMREETDPNFTLPWLWLGAIALGSGGLFLLWKSLQNPSAHKRAALNRRQRRGTVLLTEKPQPLRVPQRQPRANFSPEHITPKPLEAPEPSPELTSPPPAPPQKSFNFEVNRNPKPVQHQSLQVPNFPKLTPDIPQGSTAKPVRKTPPQDRQEQKIRKSS